MKSNLNTLKKTLYAGLGTIGMFAATQLHAQLQWTAIEGPNVNNPIHYNWTDSENWLDGEAAELEENRSILLQYPGLPAARHIVIEFNLGPDEEVQYTQTLSGGLVFHNITPSPSSTKFDLKGNKLIFDGGEFRYWRNVTASTGQLDFLNGVVQFGTVVNGASIDLGTPTSGNSTASGANNWMVLGEDVVFDAVNLADIKVAANNSNFIHRYGLDLSEATIRSGSGSSNENVLRVTGAVQVGYHSSTISNNFMRKEGDLRVGQVRMIDIGGDLIVGKNLGSSVDSHTHGTLEVADSTESLSVSVGGNVDLGVGWKGEGTMDLSNRVLSDFSVAGNVQIGVGNHSVGTLSLREGDAYSTNLAIGTGHTVVDETKGRSLVTLDKTTWSVTGDLTVGEYGDLELIIGSSSAGIVVENDLIITEGGVIEILFAETVLEDSIYGIRWKGDHQTELLSYIDLGNIMLADGGLYNDSVTVSFDGEYTNYGIQVIPEPHTWLLIGMMAGALLIWRKRK